MYFVYLLLHFVLAVFLHAADITACASYEIEAVDGTGSRLIRQHLKFRIVWMFCFGSRKFEVSTGNDYGW